MKKLSTSIDKDIEGRRVKAVTLLRREEAKGEKRQVVVDALTAKLTAKYAKQDSTFAFSITSMVNRLLVAPPKRVMKADIVALEAVIKKMSQERQIRKTTSSSIRDIRAQGVPEKDVTANCEKEAKGFHASMGPLKGHDEWVLLNALAQVEFESDQEKEKAQLIEKKRTQKSWLDVQQQEKHKSRDDNRKAKDQAFEFQVQELSKWRKQESAKQQRQHEYVLKIRRERDEQLKQQSVALEQREAQRRKEETIEVERVQTELKRLESDARQRRQAEYERMKKVQAENILVEHHKNNSKLLEHQKDIKLMEAYARRLAKEDEDRERRLQSTLQRRDQRVVIAESLQAQIRHKTLEDERRADEYQKKKDAAELLRQQEGQTVRRKEAFDIQQFLLEQRVQKKQRERQEVDNDLTFARQYHAEGCAAIEAQQRQNRDIRQRNKNFQEKLIIQMAEQRQSQLILPVHLPLSSMDSREKLLNAKLLQKLNDPDVGQKVLEKLSPMKEMPGITTTFY